MYINDQYILQGELELNKLFNIEDITEIAKNKYKYIFIFSNCYYIIIMFVYLFKKEIKQYGSNMPYCF